jgi:tetratricopeptide (TPR) repeat protein
MTKESIAALQHALEINPSNAGAWSALAITYLTMGEQHRQDVEKCLGAALGLDPDSYLALTALTNLRRQQGRKNEARQHALAAIALRPQRPEAYGMLGARESIDRRLEDRPKKSIEWLAKALERQSNNSYYLSEMGKAHRELGEYAEAVVWFDKALKADTSGEQQYGKLANRGDAYRLTKQFDLAEADLRRALGIRPDFTFAMSALMKLCKDCKRHEEGLNLANSLLSKNKSAQNQQQQKELLTLFQQDRKESTDLTERLVRGRVDVRAESTYRDAERARHLYSRNHHAWGLMGRCFVAKRDFVAARKHAVKAFGPGSEPSPACSSRQ